MQEHSHAAIDLDSRLAEIDKRLQAIQSELRPAEQEPHAEAGGSGREGPLASLLEQQRRAWPRAQEERSVHEPPPSAEEPPPPPPEPPPREPPPRARRQPPPSPPPRREPPPPAAADELAALTEVHMRLLASSQELLDAYRAVIDRLRHRAPTQRDWAPDEVTVDVGPFASHHAVRAFEAALATLPGVAGVRIRGYERGDHAIIEVQLVQLNA